jgi:hypothetical protein
MMVEVTHKQHHVIWLSKLTFSLSLSLSLSLWNTLSTQVIVVASDAKPGSWFREHLIPEDSDDIQSRLASLDASGWWVLLLSGYCQPVDSDSSAHYSDVAPSPGYDGSDPTGIVS